MRAIWNLTACLALLLLFAIPAFSQWNEEEFSSPGNSYKASAYYHWQNGHITKEAVKKDLESMKAVGMGSFYLFNTAEGVPPGPVPYMSENWWKIYEYLQQESQRLGLEMGVMNGAGWAVSGGPWVKPEDSMQEVVWTEQTISGPSSFEGVLKEPVPCLGFERDMQRDPVRNRRYYYPRERLVGQFHDIITLAFPTPLGERNGNPYHIDGWWGKAGFSRMSSWSIDKNEAPDPEIVHLEDMIDLTDKVGKDGVLRWIVPEGTWTILRIGHQPTGKQNHPSPEEGRGLEVDKLSAKALERYWNTSTSRLLGSSGAVSTVLVDSYESGHQNWTPGFEKLFLERMGYDPRPYLPAVAGRVVESTRQTERFLWDYRKVISDLLLESFYDKYASLCHENGVRFAIEPYGQFGNDDDFSMGKNADILVGEFGALGETERSFVISTVKLSSSLSHLYGKKVVGAEAFTNNKNNYELHPGNLKTLGDHYFCQGMNQIWLHSYVHDPYDKIPGISLGTYGGHFNRKNSWWSYSKPWFDYLARCQYMLQQGESVNDILYYMGEDAPSRAPYPATLSPAIPDGYDFDFCGGSEILQSLKAGKGTVETRTGRKYKLLVVRPQKYMTVNVLKQLLSLVRAGASIYLETPDGTPGLSEDQDELTRLTASVWRNRTGESVRYGKGVIYRSGNLRDILENNHCLPDFEIKMAEGYEVEITQYPDEIIAFTHRRGKASDVYFVSNQQKNKPIELDLIFNVGAKTPEIWNPLDGSVEIAGDYNKTPDNRMSVRLTLEAAGSAFVVFRKPFQDPKGESTPSKDLESVTTLDDNWRISLVPGFAGGGKTLDENTLFNLSKSGDPRVKYHSGEILYVRHFEAHNPESNSYTLDLGKVAVLAQVNVNGQDAGILWCTPYRTDISNFVKAGDNVLEIKVVTLLFNRIAGDFLLPEDCEWTTETGSTAAGYSLARIPQWVLDDKESPTGRKTFVTWKWPYIKDRTLQPTGLLGPVVITSRSKPHENE